MWISKSSNGRSAGMILMWKSNMFEVYSSFEGEGFVWIQFKWKDSLVCVVYIYSSCLIRNKRKMWLKFIRLKLIGA